jgi:hypothetical protein
MDIHTIEVICAWCNKLIKYERSQYEGVSHGICDQCAEELIDEDEDISQE